jgi:hypothetical protein
VDRADATKQRAAVFGKQTFAGLLTVRLQVLMAL